MRTIFEIIAGGDTFFILYSFFLFFILYFISGGAFPGALVFMLSEPLRGLPALFPPALRGRAA